jgi:hypothetical protein
MCMHARRGSSRRKSVANIRRRAGSNGEMQIRDQVGFLGRLRLNPCRAGKHRRVRKPKRRCTLKQPFFYSSFATMANRRDGLLARTARRKHGYAVAYCAMRSAREWIIRVSAVLPTAPASLKRCWRRGVRFGADSGLKRDIA